MILGILLHLYIFSFSLIICVSACHHCQCSIWSWNQYNS